MYLDLIDTLIEEVLIVGDDLDADVLLGLEVLAQNSTREGRLAQQVLDHVAASNDGLGHDRKVLGRLESRATGSLDDLLSRCTQRAESATSRCVSSLELEWRE